MAAAARRVGQLADTPGDDHKAKPLERYWTKGKGLARWAASSHPYTTLVKELRKEIPPGDMTDQQLHGLAAKYYHIVKGHWPGKGKGERRTDATSLTTAAQRRVRTPEGARFYRQPVGSVIETDKLPENNEPFPGYTRNYRGDTLNDIPTTQARRIAEAIQARIHEEHYEYEHERSRPEPPPPVTDIDTRAVAEAVIAARLNVPAYLSWQSGDDLPEPFDDETQIDRIGDDLGAIMAEHSGFVDDRPLSPDVFGPRRTVRDLTNEELVQAYTDFAGALDVFYPDRDMDSRDENFLFGRVMRTGLNVRLVTHRDATSEQQQVVLNHMQRLYE